MRAAIWITLFLLGLLGVLLPASYLYVASGLPSLETEFELHAVLAQEIEGERTSYQSGLAPSERRDVTFERPDFTRLPKDLVALFISQIGCPTYFQTPREDGLPWAWRLFRALVFGSQPDGDGWCERYLAISIAQRAGVKGGSATTIAANKLHTFLQKDELVSYFLASYPFDRAVVGVEDAALVLYGKRLEELPLAQLAELMLAFDYYEDIKSCRNASLIKQHRDGMIRMLADQSLIPDEKAEQAQSAPIFCLQ